MVHKYSSYFLYLFCFHIFWQWTYQMKVITEIDHAHLDIYVFITLLVLHILYIWWSWTIFGLISPVVCGGGGSCFVYVSCVCLHIVVSNIYYVVFLVFFCLCLVCPVSFCLSVSFSLYSLAIQYNYLSLT